MGDGEPPGISAAMEVGDARSAKGLGSGEAKPHGPLQTRQDRLGFPGAGQGSLLPQRVRRTPVTRRTFSAAVWRAATRNSNSALGGWGWATSRYRSGARLGVGRSTSDTVAPVF